jgi:hypothetical protein
MTQRNNAFNSMAESLQPYGEVPPFFVPRAVDVGAWDLLVFSRGCAMFNNRVEIVSPGGLPAGMTEADLGVKSVPRNPLLFGILYRMNAVEQIGSGIM